MKKKPKLLIACLALLLLAGAMLAVYLSARPETAAGTKEITVEVTHADGRRVSFTYQTGAEYLGEVLLSQGLVEGEAGEYGLYLITVDGEDAVYEEDGAYWALYKNGEYAVTGADTTPIADGDVFGLVYTK